MIFDLFGSDDDEPDDDDDFGFDLNDAANVSCPYCGESVEIPVDPAGGEVQEYVEDCAVCCQPWSVRVDVNREGVPTVSVRTLDEI